MDFFALAILKLATSTLIMPLIGQHMKLRVNYLYEASCGRPFYLSEWKSLDNIGMHKVLCLYGCVHVSASGLDVENSSDKTNIGTDAHRCEQSLKR